MSELVAAISLGLLGSFHCIGMCGPIAMALPVSGGGAMARFNSVLIYNAGRVLTYSLLGLVFGLIGQGFAIAGLQQILSIALGVFILLYILIPKKYQGANKLTASVFSFTSKIKNSLGILFKNKSRSSMFAIGLLNGLLPCGLVYMGIAGALASANVFNGALFMAVFGIGTVPVMLTVSLSRNLFSVSFRNSVRKSVPYFVSVMALMLVLRGMNLGIPYLSPKMNIEKNSFASCHTSKNCCHKK